MKIFITIILGTFLNTLVYAGNIPTADVVGIAINAGSFKTLLAAVKVAKLEGLLRGAGPLTVFAPTDNAFAKLPSDVLQSLLNNPTALRKLILGHVVAGKEIRISSLRSAAIFSSNGHRGGPYPFLSMASGQVEHLSCGDEKLFCKIGKSNYVATNIQASNGIIQVIDTVLSPLDLVTK
jgi:transforming growth factor-beta-induced protein